MNLRRTLLTLLILCCASTAWAQGRPFGLALTAGQWSFDDAAAREAMTQTGLYTYTPLGLGGGLEVQADQTEVTFQDDTEAVSETAATLALSYAGLNHSFAAAYRGLDSSAEDNQKAAAVALNYLFYQGYLYSIGLDLGQATYPKFRLGPARTEGLNVDQAGLNVSFSLASGVGLDLRADHAQTQPEIPGFDQAAFDSFGAGLRFYAGRLSASLGGWGGERFSYIAPKAMTLYSNTNVYTRGVGAGARWVLGPASAIFMSYNQESYREANQGDLHTSSGWIIGMGLSL